MERTSRKKPGYDCRDGKCKHKVKGEHGICGDIWYYTVREGELALSIYVLSNDFPPDVEPPSYKPLHHGRLIAGDLSMHVGYPLRENDEERECDWLPGKKCYGSYSTALGGMEFFETHGVDQYEQPESFWQAMEAKFHEWAPEYQPPTIEKGSRVVEI